VLRAVIVDVGGTLWPNSWPEHERDLTERIGRLRRSVPTLAADEATALVQALSAPLPLGALQPTEHVVVDAIQAVCPSKSVAIDAVVNAMCLPAKGRVRPFAGTTDLLAGLAERRVRVVIASNVVWRSADAHRRDFDDLHLSNYVDAYVTSLDVGWRKPDERFLDAALAVAGALSAQCAMVGDSEVNDIVPARDRGMVTVRVAIEEPLPTNSVADHVCGSLREVADVLRG
jgi:FMN phosphatase YigB (HAD superfamily)